MCPTSEGCSDSSGGTSSSGPGPASCSDGVRNGGEHDVDCGGPRCPPCGQEPPIVVFDTDMGPDIDDALALAMLHAYASEGQIELGAVTISRNGVWGARFSDALNTFYGRPDIPIGMYSGSTGNNSDIYSVIASDYPYALEEPVEEGYRIHRQVLASAIADQRPVVFIQVGFSGNVARLLESGPDDISDLTGLELVTDGAASLSIMAGNFSSSSAEFNIANDLPAAQVLFASWPRPMTVSGWHVGGHLLYPYSAITEHLDASHPVRAAYEFQDLSWHEDAPPYYNMRSWDLTSVLEALDTDEDYFARSEPGTVTLDGGGVTTFEANAGGQHRVLTPSTAYSAEQSSLIIDRMIELVR